MLHCWRSICQPTTCPIHTGNVHRQRFKLQQEGKGLYLLAWQEQLPVGYVLLHFRHPAYHASCQHYPECAYVEALTTHPDKQRQGVAASLMQITEAYARQASSGKHWIIGGHRQCTGTSPLPENGISTNSHRSGRTHGP
jgi:GNAT superfamily N-acetyltransferase